MCSADIQNPSFKFGHKAQLSIRLSKFDIPPMQDILLVGKKSQVGPEALRRMVDAISPEQYEIISLDHQVFEAVIIKKSLIKQIPQSKILPIILEEGERIAAEDAVIKMQIDIIVQVSRDVYY